jgi:plasmid maintenance system antidote protein VapI
MEPLFHYDVTRLRRDMVLRGWGPVDLAHRAKVSDETVYRFLKRRTQTPRTAHRLSRALGYSVRRYLEVRD